MTDKTMPALRFRGFYDAWEQRKLGKVAKVTMGQSPNGANYTENPNDYILIQGNADMKKGHVVPRIWTTQVTKMADKGDLILSVRAPVGDVGKSDYDAVLGRGVAGIKGNEFVYQSLIRMKKVGYWRTLITGSTFESINSKDIKDANISLPSETEQNKIGNFFSMLDIYITQNGRKIDLLKHQKQAYLQKIFSQELRFAGFNDLWKKCKIVDLFEERSERSPHGQMISVTMGSGVVLASSLDRKDNSSFDKSNYKVVRKNDIAYNSMRMWQGASGVSPYNGIVSPAYTIITPKANVDSGFFAIQFKMTKSLKTFQKYSQGLTSDTWNLKYPALSSIPMITPDFTEQKKINQFFGIFDDLIDKYEKKVLLLKQKKRSYLQKMFV